MAGPIVASSDDRAGDGGNGSGSRPVPAGAPQRPAPVRSTRTSAAVASRQTRLGGVAQLGGKTGLVIGGMAVMIAGWWLTSVYLVGERTLPPPPEVFETILELLRNGALVSNFSASIGAIVLGFAIGSLVGLPLGVLVGSSQFWRVLLEAPITVILSMPGLAYGVLMLAAFGLGTTGPIVAATLVAMPYVVINTAEGIRAVDRDLVRMSRSYQRGWFQIARHVLVPSVTPYLFASLRYAFAQGWKIVAIVEVFGATNGIGFMIRSTYQSYSIDGMLAWTISFVAVMLFLERVLLVQVERRVFRWRSA